MKTTAFLALPVVITLVNLLFVVFLLQHGHAQPVLHDEARGVACLDAHGGQDCAFAWDAQEIMMENQEASVSLEDDGPDPMLQPMPGLDFEAYVRADVSTFYGEVPGSRTEAKPLFRGQACKFVNMSPHHVTIYWVDANGNAVLNGNTGPWQSGGTACHPSHSFVFTKPNQPNDILCRIKVVSQTQVYYCNPFVENDPTDPAHGTMVSSEVPQSLETLAPNDWDKYQALVYNLEFAALYKNFTGGSEWLSMFPRNPPRHPIWRADHFGQQHTVRTRETHFDRLPQDDALHALSVSEMRRNATDDIAFSDYRQPGVLDLTLTALSCAPRIFEIPHFLSDQEVDHLVNVVLAKHGLERSTTNGHLSSTRTSRTTWLPRHTDPVVDAIFRRGADVLRMDEALLRHRQADERPEMPTSAPMNEDLQIVHYEKGQEYTAHHDFSYPTGLPDSPSRSINLCIYLNDVPQGGQTSFPRWRHAGDGRSLDVTPQKGKAVVFYMVTPDGNLDDLTQHAALPVLEGEKYFANLWIWDPIRS